MIPFNRFRPQRRGPFARRRSPRAVLWGLVLLLVGFSSLCGWLLSQAPTVAVPPSGRVAQTAPIGTVDVVPPALQLAQETYLARCATCHIGIPPAVLPSETWKAILEDNNHYGIPWEPLRNPELALIWKYVRNFSRPLNAEETVPYRIARSRYFALLHPQMKFVEPVKLGTCMSCHPGVANFNFRDLTPQAQNPA